MVWNDIMEDVKESLPKFNDDLLLDFRKRKIDEMPKYLDEFYTEGTKLFNYKLKYLGGVTLTPEERLAHTIKDNYLNGNIYIKECSTTIMKFTFEFEGQLHSAYLAIPFLKDGHYIAFNGVQFFPQFSIVEKAIHVSKNDVKIKMMRVPITFWRNRRKAFMSVNGVEYNDVNVTVKIHQGVRRRGKRTENTPLILYLLVIHGFDKTLKLMDMTQKDISIVNTAKEGDDNFEYFKVSTVDEVYVKVNREILTDMYKRRFLISLLAIFEYYDKFTYTNYIAKPRDYFQTALGKYTNPAKNRHPRLWYGNAESHLETSRTLLNPTVKYQLQTVNINATDIYDLLKIVFYNIDSWMAQYNPTNLYDKRIGDITQITSDLVQKFFNNQFNVINDKKVVLDNDKVKNFIARSSNCKNWFKDSKMFRVAPSVYNDNWLLTIGLKRFRSNENIESSANTNKTKNSMSIELLKSHPSHMVVESLVNIPSSSSIVAGTINPFLKIDRDGNITPEEWTKELDHIFD